MNTAKAKNTQEKTHGKVGSVLYDNSPASGHLIAKLTGCDNSISDKTMGKDIVLLTRMQMQRMGVSDDS